MNKRKGPRRKERRSSGDGDRQKQAATTRRRIKALLGNECFICGYRACLRALELHHLDPSQKNFNISMNVTRLKWAELVKEILLCVLVCNRCHSEVEEGIVEISKGDVPTGYYKRLRESIKPAKGRFKSRIYDKRKRIGKRTLPDQGSPEANRETK